MAYVVGQGTTASVATVAPVAADVAVVDVHAPAPTPLKPKREVVLTLCGDEEPPHAVSAGAVAACTEATSNSARGDSDRAAGRRAPLRIDRQRLQQLCKTALDLDP